MTTESPFEIRVYDKARQWQGNIGAPKAVAGSVFRHKAGSLQLTIAGDDPMASELAKDGARVYFGYRGAPLMSGMRRGLNGLLMTPDGLQCTIEGDRRMLANTLAWVAARNPIAPTSLSATDGTRLGQSVATGTLGAAGTIAGQGGYMTWPTSISSAEGLVKWLLTENMVTRLGLPVTIATNQDRGGNARAAGVLPLVRFSSIAEAIQPILDWSGLVVTAIQRPGQVTTTIDVRVGQSFPGSFTPASGILTDGTWAVSPPSATRGVVGGPGQDAARAFYAFSSPTLEAQYGDVIEVFKDATGANLTWPSTLDQTLQVAKYYLLRTEVAAADKATFQAYLAAAAADGLVDGQATTSISATLSETDAFHFGGTDGVQLGDLLGIIPAGWSDPIVDAVDEAQFSFTADQGLVVKPIVGELTTDPRRAQATLIARLFATQRRLSRNR